MIRLAALAAAACCLLAPAEAGASGGASGPPAALSVSPSRIELAGAGTQTIRIANPGASRVTVDVSRAGFALDPHGKPLVGAAGRRSARTWLTARPSRLALAPGGVATLTVVSHLPRRAEPGDHGALVLLTTRPARAARVAVQLRLGVVVTVRAPGRVVHRLALGGLRVRRRGRVRLLELAVANRGNVTERLPHVRVRLLRGRRVVATLRSARRELLPRTGGLVDLRYRGRARGFVRAEVSLGRLRRTFKVRL